MKKTILTLVLACGIIETSFAQNKFSVTQLSNAKNMYEGNQTGFVGIGNANPQSNLQVSNYKDQANNDPYAILEVSSTQYNYNTGFPPAGTGIGARPNNSFIISHLDVQMDGPPSGEGHAGEITDNTAFVVKSSGNVGINTYTPQTTLDIQGNVRIGNVATPAGYSLYVEQGVTAEKFKYALNNTSDWSDYVFAKDYKLATLSDVDAFIKENHHLPDVPSAEEVVCSGVDMAKMDATLLRKVGNSHFMSSS
jgi:hypothetical protein